MGHVVLHATRAVKALCVLDVVVFFATLVWLLVDHPVGGEILLVIIALANGILFLLWVILGRVSAARPTSS